MSQVYRALFVVHTGLISHVLKVSIDICFSSDICGGTQEGLVTCLKYTGLF